MLNQIIWWTGASVLSAGALLGAALIVTVISITAVRLGRYYGQRVFNVADNLVYMHAWRRAGCPKISLLREEFADKNPDAVFIEEGE